MSNCCLLRPAAYINKQNGGESCKFVNSDFQAFYLKKYTIDREDMFLKLNLTIQVSSDYFELPNVSFTLKKFQFIVMSRNTIIVKVIFFPCYITKHLMCTPSGNSEFCFPESLKDHLPT